MASKTLRKATTTPARAPRFAAASARAAGGKATPARPVAKSVKAAPARSAAKPVRKPPAKAAAKPAAKPVAKPAAKPAPRALKAPAKAARPAPKPVAKAPARPAPRPAAKPAPRPAAKPPAKPVAKAARPAPKPVAKPAAKPAAKPVARVPAKPVAPAPRPAAKAPAKPPAPAAPVKKAAPKKFVLDKFTLEQRDQLLEERSAHVSQAQSLKDEADALAAEIGPGESEFGEEGGEGGNLAVERELDLALSAQARTAVEEIDRALAKIDHGTYGVCEKCGKDIPRARLKVLPHAPLCVACKSGGLSRR